MARKEKKNYIQKSKNNLLNKSKGKREKNDESVILNYNKAFYKENKLEVYEMQVCFIKWNPQTPWGPLKLMMERKQAYLYAQFCHHCDITAWFSLVIKVHQCAVPSAGDENRLGSQ